MASVHSFAGRLFADADPVGSACCVHSSGLVVTCWHVVEPALNRRAQLRFAALDPPVDYSLEPSGALDARHDLLLLRPAAGAAPTAVPVARLLSADSSRPGDVFSIQGFGEVADRGHTYDWLSATGTVIGPVERDGIRVLAVESRQVLRGMSGAPVVLPELSGVVGILTARYTAPPDERWLRDTAWVIPAERIAELAPEVLSVTALPRAQVAPREKPAIWQLRGLRPAAHFTGRTAELDLLHTALAPGHPGICAVTGMGGVGKTRLALAYAERRAHTYDVVWLARAASLTDDLRELATSLGLETAGANVDSLLHGWFATHDRWLVIVDGADDAVTMLDALPAGRGHLLITSRDTAWSTAATVLPLDVLQRADATGFLRHRGVPGTDEELDALAESVGDLPLALEHAAAFLLATARPVHEYRALLRDRAAALLPVGYPTAVATTWAISFERLRKEVPAASELLRIAAFFATDDIPLDLIRAAATHLPRRYRRPLSDKLHLVTTLGGLTRYSLAQLTADALSVHTLIQTAVRDLVLSGPERNRYASLAVRALGKAYPEDADDVDNWPAAARLTPHVLAAAEHAEPLNVEPRLLSWLLDRSATYLEDRFRDPAALPMHERALAIAERALKPDSIDTCSRLNNLGHALFQADRLEEARAVLRRALVIDRERHRKLGEPLSAPYLVNLGTVEYLLGNETQGRALMLEAVHVANTADSTYGRVLRNPASWLLERGELQAATELAELALRAEERRVGTHHPEYAVSMRQWAEVVHACGNTDEAVHLYAAATKIFMDRMGPDHHATAEAFQEELHFLYRQGLVEQALPVARRMAQVVKFSVHSYEALVTGGILLLLAGAAQEALQCFAQAATLAEAAHGPTSWQLARHESNIGMALIELHRTTEAVQHLDEAMRLADPLLDTLTPIYQANLAIALADDGQATQALSTAAQAEEAAHAPTSDDSNIWLVLEKVARAEATAGQPERAHRHLTEAIHALEARLGPDSPRVARLCALRSASFEGRGAEHSAPPDCAGTTDSAGPLDYERPGRPPDGAPRG
ncbi:tetratricopeptide repeat protein [Streptomyces sp. NPDC042319]|uniref:tetratricopeptide repeat protein n=1 Tax=Streptomyces sp. NPDC042319 TaxID=3154332 RepID=UPI0033EDEA8D